MTVSQSCQYNILQVTPTQLEYFVEDVVTLTCLRNCRCGTESLFCEPLLFYGNNRTTFGEDFMNVTLNNSCSYYNYSLGDLNVVKFEGQNLSCGGIDRDGTLNVSNPLQLSVKPGEATTITCRVICLHLLALLPSSGED